MRKVDSTVVGVLAWVVSATLLAIFCGEIEAKAVLGKRRAISTQSAKRATPRYSDINRFIERREVCDHFRGEDSDDRMRKRFINHQLDKFCGGTDAQLSALRQKYRNNWKIKQRLFRYDNQVE